MKVFVISPHMDDETLGMGGTIAKHVDRGDIVHVAVIAHRVYDRVYDEDVNKEEKENTLLAKDVLGYHEVEFFGLDDERLDICTQDILIPLEKYYNRIKPDIVYTNFYGDNNQDHRAVFDAVRIIIRPTASHKAKKVLMYETPSSTDQSPPIEGGIFTPNYYVSIKEELVRKINAIRCYQREKRAYPHPRSEEAVKILAQKRGVEVGMKFAESFIMLRGEWE